LTGAHVEPTKFGLDPTQSDMCLDRLNLTWFIVIELDTSLVQLNLDRAKPNLVLIRWCQTWSKWRRPLLSWSWGPTWI